jgi:hypothetical protein
VTVRTIAWIVWLVAVTAVLEGPSVIADLWRHGAQRGGYVHGVYTREPNGPPWWKEWPCPTR